MQVTGALVRADLRPQDCLSEESRALAEWFRWSSGTLTPWDGGLGSLADEDGILMIFDRAIGPAPWEGFIQHVFDPPGFEPRASRSLGALFFVQVGDPRDPGGVKRWVGWAFGSASRMLRPSCLEPRFGLFAALNEVTKAAESGLRQVEFRTFGAYRQRAGHTAGRDTPIGAFGVDPLSDLLSGIGGRTGGERSSEFYGGRSIRRSMTVDSAETLARVAQDTMNEYRDTSYSQTEFAFVDDFVPVDSPTELGHVRDELARLIMAGSDRIDALMPDDLVLYEDPRAIHYVVLPKERAAAVSRTTLTPSNLARAIGEAGADGLHQQIRFLDSSRQEVARARVVDCLAADLELEEGRYVVTEGDIFRVSASFLEGIDAQVGSIAETGLMFEPYRSGPEPDWLTEVAATAGSDFIRLDPATISLPGETAFEAADLVHRSGSLVHAKRKGRSTTLCYAMEQAKRSSQMLATSPGARTRLGELIASADAEPGLRAEAADRLVALENRPSHVPVALVLLGRPSRRGLPGLPLYAKLELVDTVRLLSVLGYDFGVHVVGV